jgi:hypothetical protein
MRLRSTGILLVVFALLAGYVYFFEIKKPLRQAPVDKSTWVLTLALDDVQQLTVANLGRSAAFVKSDGVWHIGASNGEEADSTRLESVLLSLVDLQATRALTQSLESLATYGLESPAMTVALGLINGGQETLLFGDRNPGGTQYYVLHKGSDPVFLVYAALADDLRGLVDNPPLKPTPLPATPVAAPIGASTPAP